RSAHRGLRRADLRDQFLALPDRRIGRRLQRRRRRLQRRHRRLHAERPDFVLPLAVSSLAEPISRRIPRKTGRDLSMDEPTAPADSEAVLQARFEALQRRLVPLWRSISSLNQDEQTIVVIPSMTVDREFPGSMLQAYEERFLFLLFLLRQPRARLVYVT